MATVTKLFWSNAATTAFAAAASRRRIYSIATTTTAMRLRQTSFIGDNVTIRCYSCNRLGLCRSHLPDNKRQEQWPLSSSLSLSTTLPLSMLPGFQSQTHQARTMIVSVLRERIESGQLYEDKVQAKAAKRLERLQQALVEYDNEPLYQAREQELELERQKQQEQQQQEQRQREQQEKSSDKTAGVTTTTTTTSHTTQAAASEALETIATPKIRIPRGLYLYGPVGSGKSMLMDTFYEHAETNKKKRFHFHAFMAQVHQRIHALKQHDLQTTGRQFHIDPSYLTEQYNPIVRIGLQLSRELSLVCLDEFQVTDVADALILSQLFHTMFRMGTVLVATSNRPPTDLYQGGINRSYFMPFVDLLEKHCIVHSLQQSTVDYRTVLAASSIESFYFVADDNTKGDVGSGVNDQDDNGDVTSRIDSVVNSLRNGQESTLMYLPATKNSGGGGGGTSSSAATRHIFIPSVDADGTVARFDFSDLCRRQKIGASDYARVAQEFKVVVVENIPILTTRDPRDHDPARRLILLIDELYEHRTALICSAAANPNDLFQYHHHDDNDENESVNEDNLNDDPKGEQLSIDQAISRGTAVATIASVRELDFAFARAASRLKEMTSRKWWEERAGVVLAEKEDEV